MRRALVTGATSGLGRSLVPALLDAGYGVRASGRNPLAGAELASMGAEFVPLDLRSNSEMEPLTQGVDLVVHAAALSSPWGALSEFEAVNVAVTANLVAAAKRAGADTFIFISTPSIYAEPRDRLGLTESSPPAARLANNYVKTKYAAERLALAANGPDLTTLALRPRAIIGPHDQTLLPRLIRVAKKGYFPVFRGGRAEIDVTDARDVADAILRADRCSRSIAGRAYNISGGQPLTVASLLDAAFLSLKLNPKRVEMSYALAASMCGAMEAVCGCLPNRPEPPATVYSLGTLAFSQTFDIAAARRDLAWSPRFSPNQSILWAAGGLDAKE